MSALSRKDIYLSWAFAPPYDGVVWLAWLYVFAACIYAGGGPFEGRLIWFDDNVRMVQVLDWINGAGWYDHTITRVNAPEGFHTIWSRLVDIPIAAIILAFQGMVGQKQAALMASIILPLLQVLLLFYAASYFARPLVGSRHAKLVTLFVLFSSCINNEYFTLAGFQLGAAGHHAWYVLLTLVLLGANGRMVMRHAGQDRLIAAFSISVLLVIGIEGLPFIAGMCFFLGLISWLQNQPRLALHGAKALGLGALLGFLFLPINQPIGKILIPSFAEPSILGPTLVSCAAILLGAECLILERLGSKKALSILSLALITAALAAAIIYMFPHILEGPAAALTPEERLLASKEHTEAMPLFTVSINTIDYIRLIMPSLLAIAFAASRLLKGGSRPARAVHILYLSFALLTLLLASVYARFYHYVVLMACPWLLEAWLVIREKFKNDGYRHLKSSLLFLALGPLWMWAIPAANYDEPFGTQVLLFPAKHQASKDVCDVREIGEFLNTHYPPDTLLIVPMYRSSRFLFETNLRLFFLASFPSNNKFIEAREFYDAADPNIPKDIAFRHAIDLVAVCKVSYHVTPLIYALLKGRLSFGQQLASGQVPSWLTPVDLHNDMPYLLFKVNKGG